MRELPNPDVYLRHAAGLDSSLPASSPSATIARTVRTDVPLPDDIGEVELKQYALETELRQMRDRVRHLEQALRTAGRVLQPYLAGSGR